MAPVVAARTTGEDNTAGFSFAPTLPPGVTAGDLLIVAVASDDGPTHSTSSSGWAELIDSSATAVSGAVYWKEATGSDALTVSTSTSQRNTWASFRITGWTGAPQVAAATNSTGSTNANPPSLTPSWGSKDTLWIATAHWDGTITPSAPPTNYSQLQTRAATDSANGVSTASAERTLTAATEDPGAFTSATEQWVAFTIAVQPSVTAKTGSETFTFTDTVTGLPITLSRTDSATLTDTFESMVVAISSSDSAAFSEAQNRPFRADTAAFSERAHVYKPDFVLRVPADLPRPGMRFLAQGILTGTWLDWDLPISDAELVHTLNGFGGITGKVTPEYPDLKTAGLEDDAVWIFAEQDGQIRNHGILRLDAIDGQGLTFDAEGFCSYPHGMVCTWAYSQENVDPLVIVRDIWTRLQGLAPETNLGILLDQTTSPIRLGTEKREETTTDANGQTVTKEVTVPYQLNWYEKKDLGREIDALQVEGKFDYAESAAWNSTRTDVDLRLRLGYPRLGRKRTDLRFAQDENLLAAVPLKQDPAQWATYVFVAGAGEGSAMIVGYAGQRVGNKVGRMKVVEDKSITTKQRATAVARDILRRSQASVLSISEIIVDARHPNAPYGSFEVGDDVSILADIPWIESVALSHRIVSISYSPQKETATLQLQPSDAFSYEAL